jgi:DNA polymerase-3 subunit epsilon
VRAAELLDTHPDYRVLRALPAFEAYPLAQPQGQVRTAAVIDVETIGLNLDHPIIDLAIHCFRRARHDRSDWQASTVV